MYLFLSWILYNVIRYYNNIIKRGVAEMSYYDEYKQKLTTAEAIAATIKSHSMVKYGYFNAKPQMLDKALAARHGEL